MRKHLFLKSKKTSMSLTKFNRQYRNIRYINKIPMAQSNTGDFSLPIFLSSLEVTGLRKADVVVYVSNNISSSPKYSIGVGGYRVSITADGSIIEDDGSYLVKLRTYHGKIERKPLKKSTSKDPYWDYSLPQREGYPTEIVLPVKSALRVCSIFLHAKDRKKAPVLQYMGKEFDMVPMYSALAFLDCHAQAEVNLYMENGNSGYPALLMTECRRFRCYIPLSAQSSNFAVEIERGYEHVKE